MNHMNHIESLHLSAVFWPLPSLIIADLCFGLEKTSLKSSLPHTIGKDCRTENDIVYLIAATSEPALLEILDHSLDAYRKTC